MGFFNYMKQLICGHDYVTMNEGDEESFGVKYKLGHFSKFRILVAVTVILGLLLVTFVALFGIFVVKWQNSKANLKEQKAHLPSLCNSKDCVYASVDVLNQINQSADPCDDFFTYACGGYIARNPLKDGQTFRIGLTDAGYKNMQVLKKSLENAAIKYPKNEAVMKTVRIYNACMNESEINALGGGPLRKTLNKYGGWDVLGNAMNSSRDTMHLLADIQRNFFVKPLINVMVSVDYYNSSTHILQLGAAELGMGKSFYSSNSARNIMVQNAYKKYMKKIGKLLGGSADSDKKMMEVYEFEAKLAKIGRKEMGSSITEAFKESISGAAVSEDPFDVRTSIKTFAKQTQTSTEFVIKFLQRVFMDQKKKFTPEDRILAYPVNYFKQVVALTRNQSQMNPKVIDNYIMWILVNDLIPDMSSNFTNAWSEFKTAMTGTPTGTRWQTCIKGMQSFLPMAMGFLFVDSAFDEQSKKTVEEMSKYLRNSFLQQLESNNWMSDKTRLQARKKALAIKEDIGYPPYIKDPELLAAEYSGLQVKGHLFHIILSLRTFSSKQNLDLLGKAVDNDKWQVSPAEVNGYYNPQQNRIVYENITGASFLNMHSHPLVFLAGILQPPFYNPTYPKYLNFGGIGSAIGHEITHGFDTSGAQYDKNGNLFNWWSEQSNNNFKQKTQCLRTQYSKYKVFGENINGNQTLNENIADNAGIKLAYKAYLDWAKKNGTEKSLPGVGLSVDQLFFVGFAKPWCSIYTKEPALAQLRTDSHTFAKYRIIGTLSNFPKFSEAFKCKSGSAMNPVSKCSVW